MLLSVDKNKKTRLKLLETSLENTIPAVPLKLRKLAPPSGSNKPYPCNGGTREHLAQCTRHSSSEVMGLMDASCCLSPTDSSLKGYGSGPSSSQPFSYCPQCSTSTLKSQLFSTENTLLYELYNSLPVSGSGNG